MNIVFNMLECGLGNNGGTRTIIKCAETLEQLGHRCDIITIIDNFTWFDHKKTIKCLPADTDVLIATAFSTVNSTLLTNVSKKAWYIRGHENWATSDINLKMLYNSDIVNIVNSKGLQQLLAAYGADSKVVYQGIDFGLWGNKELRSKDKIRIGCLYQQKKTKRWQDFVKLAETLGSKKYEYIGIGMSDRKDSFLKDFWYNASSEQLSNVYNSCHVWFAPTELEGLHNVPIEAALCGCLIVCNDSPMNGMGFDYAFDNNTAMVYRARDIKHAAKIIKNPNWDCIERMDNVLKHDIGAREDNMKRFVNLLRKIT